RAGGVGSRGGPAAGVPWASRAADQDPAAVLFGLGYGPVHESLPFAAAVLESVRRTQPGSGGPAPALVSAGRRDPADIAERIHHLGELHRAGLVTDAEFSAKKAELLSEL
ncbi:SHOCT domain-containing protein, partial [Streptomyces californicus]|uniref:SHOCT domain-containing protein n=1 Tax=Streptomyces californicus TaxID=67351 RepID=UPI0036AC0DC9